MSSVELKKLLPGKKVEATHQPSISFSKHSIVSNKLHLLCSLQISKVTEMSLSANQEREEMEKKRLVWKVEGSLQEPKLARGRLVDPTNLVVELAPMEIRTFVLEIDSSATGMSQMPHEGRFAA